MRGYYVLLLTCLVLATTIEGRRKLKREQYQSAEERSADPDIDPDADYEDVRRFTNLLVN